MGRVCFSRAGWSLTNDADTKEDEAANLYECELIEDHGEQKCKLSDLTPENAEGAGVLGLMTASEDGSYVYFVAKGRLTGEKNGEGEEAIVGRPNLYLSHAGRVTFIATLAPDKLGYWNNEGTENGDEEDWLGEEESANANTFDYGPGQHSARVTPDGTVLAFESELGLTKFANRPAVSGECESERCREVYLYDAVSGSTHPVICVSCDPWVLGPWVLRSLVAGNRRSPEPAPPITLFIFRVISPKAVAGCSSRVRMRLSRMIVMVV